MTSRDEGGRNQPSQEAGAQARVLSFLANPSSYPLRPEQVSRIETHGAYVFLTDTEVFKIKRAVRFDYLDFSTLDKRRAACAREVELNQPQAPMLYLGLVAITEEPDGRLAFDGKGPPVEWAVHMRRFSEADVLARRAEAGLLPRELCVALADAVSDLHKQAPVAGGHATPLQMTAVVDEVADALIAATPDNWTSAVEDFRRSGHAAVARIATILNQRAAASFVRRCHGDLHLENIVVLDGQPVPFDALEFNEQMATIDTLYDLAFLLMDLDQRHQRDAANRVLNRYLWRSGDLLDLKGLAALPLFLAARAAIRAMVRAQRAAQLQNSQANDVLAAARIYLDASNAYLTSRKPLLILVGGLSGSGKSTLAAWLAPRFGACPGALHLRTDLERKSLYGVGETDRLPQSAYTPPVTAQVYAILAEKARTALEAGHSVIADAVYAREGERALLEKAGAATGAHIVGLWLDAPPEILMRRVSQRINDASDATPEVVERQMTFATGPIDWHKVDASGGAEETFIRALEQLKGF
jgi:hypothetical protein